MTVVQFKPRTYSELRRCVRKYLNRNPNNLPPIGTWNVSLITDMNNLFFNLEFFNESIENWDVSNVVNMASMFDGATAFNQPLNGWNVSNVTNMSAMFRDCSAFNQPLDRWRVSNVQDMSFMFEKCVIFNSNIENWDVSNVVNMKYMFHGARQFNQPLNDWEVGLVENMSGMFKNAIVFNQRLDLWELGGYQGVNGGLIGGVFYISEMFKGAIAFNQPLNDWDVSNVKHMDSVFADTDNFNQSLNDWDMENVKLTNSMFENAIAFNSDINGWNMGSVENCRNMFKNARVFNQPLDLWSMQSLKSAYKMFEGAVAFNQDISNWRVSSILDCNDMFKGASAFNKSINWQNANTQLLAEDVIGMFNNTPRLNRPPLEFNPLVIRNEYVRTKGLELEAIPTEDVNLNSYLKMFFQLRYTSNILLGTDPGNETYLGTLPESDTLTYIIQTLNTEDPSLLEGLGLKSILVERAGGIGLGVKQAMITEIYSKLDYIFNSCDNDDFRRYISGLLSACVRIGINETKEQVLKYIIEEIITRFCSVTNTVYFDFGIDLVDILRVIYLNKEGDADALGRYIDIPDSYYLWNGKVLLGLDERDIRRVFMRDIKRRIIFILFTLKVFNNRLDDLDIDLVTMFKSHCNRLKQERVRLRDESEQEDEESSERRIRTGGSFRKILIGGNRTWDINDDDDTDPFGLLWLDFDELPIYQKMVTSAPTSDNPNPEPFVIFNLADSFKSFYNYFIQVINIRFANKSIFPLFTNILMNVSRDMSSQDIEHFTDHIVFEFNSQLIPDLIKNMLRNFKNNITPDLSQLFDDNFESQSDFVRLFLRYISSSSVYFRDNVYNIKSDRTIPSGFLPYTCFRMLKINPLQFGDNPLDGPDAQNTINNEFLQELIAFKRAPNAFNAEARWANRAIYGRGNLERRQVPTGNLERRQVPTVPRQTIVSPRRTSVNTRRRSNSRIRRFII